LCRGSLGGIPENPPWRQIAVIFALKIKPSNAPKKEDANSSLIIQCAESTHLSGNLRHSLVTALWSGMWRSRTLGPIVNPINPRGSTFIFKTAYHNPKRIGESSFYKALQSIKIPGLAAFREGGDVKLGDMVPYMDSASK
jgi:hypothetical protein